MESTADHRDAAARERDARAQRRDEIATGRDEEGAAADARAGDRDTVGARRDQDADARDQAAEERDREAVAGDVVQEAAADRLAAADDRAAAAADRAAAHADVLASSGHRDSSGDDRGGSGEDRRLAADDRQAAAQERTAATFDSLTGAYLRGPGLVELERELDRHARSGAPFALVFLDVDGLKTVNDTHGHAAGDRLLRAVADAVRAGVRPYDLLVRFGGDEFVCALPGLTAPDAAARMAAVNTDLQTRSEHGTISVGISTLEPDDTLEALLHRADTELYQRRAHHTAQSREER